MRESSERIRVDRARADEVETLLQLYVDLFCDREPLTQCFGFSRQSMLSIARSMHGEADVTCVSQGLCWIARDRLSAHREVGFIVCDDPVSEGNQPLPGGLTEQEEAILPGIMALMEEIRRPVKERIGPDPGTCLHIAAVGVAPGYEGCGIATNLIHTAISAATARGFTHTFSECTSIASRACHEKLGFQPLHHVAVNQFSFGGSCPFPDSSVDVWLLWKDLVERTC